VRKRKASPAAARKVRDRRRVDQLGGVIGAEATPDILAMQALLSVYDGTTLAVTRLLSYSEAEHAW
jgi:hypothetical protein